MRKKQYNMLSVQQPLDVGNLRRFPRHYLIFIIPFSIIVFLLRDVQKMIFLVDQNGKAQAEVRIVGGGARFPCPVYYSLLEVEVFNPLVKIF